MSSISQTEKLRDARASFLIITTEHGFGVGLDNLDNQTNNRQIKIILIIYKSQINLPLEIDLFNSEIFYLINNSVTILKHGATFIRRGKK